MTSSLLIDLAIVAILVLFIWLGAKKGFILTLCSLVAVIVALIGATFIADTLSPMVADTLRPVLEQSIQESLEQKVQEVSTENSLGVAEVLATLREKGGLYEWAADGLENTLLSAPDISKSIAQQAATAASALAERLARGILFSVSFLLVLIAWFFISHALDLVAKLPIIHSLNESLGAVIGAVKGLLILYAGAWILCGLTGVISQETASQTYLLSFLLRYSPLALLHLA